MFGSKYDSGAEKRKRKRTHDDFMKSQQGSIFKHFKRSTAYEDLEEERVVIETANVQVMNVGSAMGILPMTLCQMKAHQYMF